MLSQHLADRCSGLIRRVDEHAAVPDVDQDGRQPCRAADERAVVEVVAPVVERAGQRSGGDMSLVQRSVPVQAAVDERDDRGPVADQQDPIIDCGDTGAVGQIGDPTDVDPAVWSAGGNGRLGHLSFITTALDSVKNS